MVLAAEIRLLFFDPGQLPQGQKIKE